MALQFAACVNEMKRERFFQLGTRWIFHKFPRWEPFFSCETPLMGCVFCFWLSEAQAAAGHKMKDLGQSLLEKTFEVPG